MLKAVCFTTKSIVIKCVFCIVLSKYICVFRLKTNKKVNKK